MANKVVKKAEVVEKKKGAIVANKETTPGTVLDFAIQNNAPLEQIEKFMELKKIWEEREAKKAYVKAMAEFHKNPPQILKTSKVDFTNKAGIRTNYNYANLAKIVEAICKQLAENELTVTWKTAQEGDKITVTCKITHTLGHYEETALYGTPDLTGNKNQIQAVGSTMTYLQRYTLLALVGLATEDMDDDGKGTEAVIEYVSDQQLKTICDIVDNLKNSTQRKPKMLEVFKVESLDKIEVKNYKAVMAILTAAQKADKEKK